VSPVSLSVHDSLLVFPSCPTPTQTRNHTILTFIAYLLVIYHAYLKVGVLGLRALRHYDAEAQKWRHELSQVSPYNPCSLPHAKWKKGLMLTHTPLPPQANFAIFRYICRYSEGALYAVADLEANKVTVQLRDSTKETLIQIKEALGKFIKVLHKALHARDAKLCRKEYRRLTRVKNEFETMRQIVCTKDLDAEWKNVQPNTFVEVGEDGKQRVVLKEYPATNEGIVQSWLERGV